MFSNKNKIMKKALLVGINYRGMNGELYGCINDIKNVKELLIQNNYNEKDIVSLSEDHDKLPTKHEIAKSLLWLLENKKNKPMEIFFHYSGHGSWIYDRNNDEEDNKDECLVPLDYKRNGMIYDDDLNELLQNNLTSNTKLFIIIDACHSGTMFDLKYQLKCNKVVRDHNNKISSDFSMKTYNYNDNLNGKIIAISGCQDNQTSADAWLERQSQGALTHSFLKTMNKYNNKLTLEELMVGIYSIIKGYNFQQSPTLSSNKSIVFDENVNL